MGLPSSFIHQLEIDLPAPISEWKSPAFQDKGIEVYVMEENLIHPWIQGNKWHKIKPWLELFFKDGHKGLASMGGPFSNHLLAMGYAAWKWQIPATAFIRGGENEWKNNPAIAQLRNWNFNLVSVDRPLFRTWHQAENGPELNPFGLEDFLWIPMGGSHKLVLDSVASWAQETELRFPEMTHLVLPVASGGTLAGFAKGLSQKVNLIAVSVVKVEDYAESLFKSLMIKEKTQVIDWKNGYHFGGFAKKTKVLQDFCKAVFEENGFQIEPVYSGKAFFAVSDLAEKGHFPPGSKVLVVHTGGIFPWNLV